MPSKRPPLKTMQAIYDACANGMDGAGISEMTGICPGTVKPAVSWMLRHDFLIGHRERKKVRYTHYTQGKPLSELPVKKDTLNISTCFAALMRYWPTSPVGLSNEDRN